MKNQALLWAFSGAAEAERFVSDWRGILLGEAAQAKVTERRWPEMEKLNAFGAQEVPSVF